PGCPRRAAERRTRRRAVAVRAERPARRAPDQSRPLSPLLALRVGVPRRRHAALGAALDRRRVTPRPRAPWRFTWTLNRPIQYPEAHGDGARRNRRRADGSYQPK